MNTSITYSSQPQPDESRAESRRRPVKRYRIPAWNDNVPNKPISNHPFTGILIAATSKAQLPALRRSVRNKYTPHVGVKQLAKIEQ